jgi:hypothetical protein
MADQSDILAMLLGGQQNPGGYSPTIMPATPQQVQQQQLAAALSQAKAGSDTSPIRSPWQGVARLADGFFGGLAEGQQAAAAKKQAAGLASFYGGLPTSFGGGGGASVTPAGKPADAGDDDKTPATTPSGGGGPSPLNSLPVFASGDPAYYAKTASIESSNDPAATNGSHKGLFQFGPAEWAQYGGGGNIFDPEAQRAAIQSYTADHNKQLTTMLGRPPTSGELYLAHQQGVGGAAELILNPDATPSSISPQLARNVANNGGNPNAPNSAFVNKWASKYDGIPSPFASAPGQQAITGALKQSGDAAVPASASAYAGAPLPLPRPADLSAPVVEGRSAAPASSDESDDDEKPSPAAAAVTAPNPAAAPAQPVPPAQPGIPPGTHWSQLPGPPLLLADAQSGGGNPLANALNGGGNVRGGGVFPGVGPSIGGATGGGGAPPSGAAPVPAMASPAAGGGASGAVGGNQQAELGRRMMQAGALYGRSDLVQAGMAMYTKAMEPQTTTVSEGQNVIDPRTGRVIYSAPKKDTADHWTNVTRADGSVVPFNTSTGQYGAPQGAPAGYRPMTQQEKTAYGVAPDAAAYIGPDGKPASLGAASTNVTVNNGEKSGEEEFAKGNFAPYTKLVSGVDDAQTRLRDLNAMQGALDNIQKAGGTTGFAAAQKLQLQKAINAGANVLGIDEPFDVSDPEFLTKFNRQIAGAQAKGAMGARVTNFEMSNYMKANPGLEMSTMGNRRLLGIQTQIEQRNVDLGNLLQEYAGNSYGPGKKPDLGAMHKIVVDYDNAHHIVDPITGQDLTDSKGAVRIPELQAAPAPTATPKAPVMDVGKSAVINGITVKRVR